MSEILPILEFDPERDAIINPRKYGMEQPVPLKGIMCFFADVIAKKVEEETLQKIGQFRSELAIHPVYRMEKNGAELFVMHPGVGAPLAAGLLEEIICWGIKCVIVCGGCGVLNPEIAAGHIVVVESAVRDEGTSYHYLPASREVGASVRVTQAIVDAIQKNKIPYLRGKTWTTDAIYRETPQRRAKRIVEGCSVVEMEASALFAVAQFRSIEIGMIVYGGDLVIPGAWDGRDWYKRKDDRQLLFDLAVEACCSL
jgi:uridine phosphorylase